MVPTLLPGAKEAAARNSSTFRQSGESGFRLEDPDTLARWVEDQEISIVRHEHYRAIRRIASSSQRGLEVLVVCRVSALLDWHDWLDQPRSDGNPPNEILSVFRWKPRQEFRPLQYRVHLIEDFLAGDEQTAIQHRVEQYTRRGSARQRCTYERTGINDDERHAAPASRRSARARPLPH